MKSKELIIKLITQDMKHTQLLNGLRSSGLNPEMHYLSIVNVVVILMEGYAGTEWTDVSDDLGKLYFGFLDEAEKLPITNDDEDLKPLAEDCYNRLSRFLSTM